MPENLSYNPDVVYPVPPDEDFIGPQLPGTLETSWTKEDLHIGTEDLYEIAGAGFSGVQEGLNQFKDLLDSLSGGLTKVYKQLYILVAGGLVLWGYSIYKK